MRFSIVAIFAAALVISTPVIAANNGNNGKKVHAAGGQVQSDQAISILITVAERAIILGYFDDNRSNLPVPLATAKPLPPGIAKKVARGGSLPPGIAKRYLPNDLITQLPSRPGYQWVVVGTDVLLIAVATSLIVDILEDVL
jgi:hypothetical protein